MTLRFEPFELALFLFLSPFSFEEQLTVLYKFWKAYPNRLSEQWRADYKLFCRQVFRIYAEYECSENELEELDVLLQDTGASVYTSNSDVDVNVVASIMKLIWLELMYVESKNVYRIKMRTLVKRLGYRRRSEKLINHLQSMINALSLQTFTRGNVPCDIAEIGFDEMVMIRLAKH